MQTLSCRLLSLHCFLSDEINKDELFLKWNGTKCWPEEAKFARLTEDSTRLQVDLKGIEIGSEVTLELWDYDLFTPNDLLGTFTMRLDERGGPFLVDLKREGSSPRGRYQLEYEVV
jgi:hypothetical protein